MLMKLHSTWMVDEMLAVLLLPDSKAGAGTFCPSLALCSHVGLTAHFPVNVLMGVQHCVRPEVN